MGIGGREREGKQDPELKGGSERRMGKREVGEEGRRAGMNIEGRDRLESRIRMQELHARTHLIHLFLPRLRLRYAHHVIMDMDM